MEIEADKGSMCRHFACVEAVVAVANFEIKTLMAEVGKGSM